jgi:DNA-binding MarR family transcriptional regulator
MLVIKRLAIKPLDIWPGNFHAWGRPLVRRYRVPVTTPPDGPAGQPGPALPRLSYLVFRLERRIRARLDEVLARHGVTTTEYMALSELSLRDGPSSAQLARIAFVTPQAMNLVIRDLERRGLISRAPAADGGRVLRARLTPAGLSTLRRCDRALDGLEQIMLATLDARDRQLLAGYLRACAHSLRDIDMDAPAR